MTRKNGTYKLMSEGAKKTESFGPLVTTGISLFSNIFGGIIGQKKQDEAYYAGLQDQQQARLIALKIQADKHISDLETQQQQTKIIFIVVIATVIILVTYLLIRKRKK